MENVFNLTQYLNKASEYFSDKIIVKDSDYEVSFKNYVVDAKKISQVIMNLCDGCNNRPIVIFGEKSILSYKCIAGILYSGNYYVPLDTKMPNERLSKVFDQLDSPLAIVDHHFIKKIHECGFGGRVIDDEELIRHCDNLNDNTLGDNSGSCIDTDPAYMLFTSGSTGVPKGVLVSHRAVIDYINWQCNNLLFDNNTVLGNEAPFYFDASMPDIFTPWCVGCKLVIIPETLFLFPVKLIRFLNDNKVNTLIWVPSALIRMVQKDYFEKEKINDLRQVMFCGEVMPNKSLNKWRKYYSNTKFVNLYGPTEAAYACTYYIVDRNFKDDEELPIGKPCANTGAIVLNDKNKPTEIDEIGELCIKGSCLALGYYKDIQKTNNSFINNPVVQDYQERIYRTGDLVKKDKDGVMWFITRKDFQIKRNGYRIELGEVENASYSINGILQSCALYDREAEEILLFCIEENEISEKEIYNELKKKIPRYMLPEKIFIVDDFPLNQNGKINRNKLLQINHE